MFVSDEVSLVSLTRRPITSKEKFQFGFQHRRNHGSIIHRSKQCYFYKKSVQVFRTVRIRHGCILSPVHFNSYPEHIMLETLKKDNTSVPISGRTMCNLRCAHGIDLTTVKE